MRWLLLPLLLLGPPAGAAEFDMLLLGVRVGEATLVARGGTIDATARTVGAARAVGPYDYAARSTAARYEEAERVRGAARRTVLRTGGAPQVVEAPEAGLAPARMRGAVDPLRAMQRVLGPRPAATACALDLRFTDGVRLGQVTLAPTADPLVCAGRWRRLAGPPPGDGRERRDRAGFTVLLAPAPGGVHARELRADGPLGDFVLRRR